MSSSNWNQVRRVSRGGNVRRVEMPKSAMYITPNKRVVYSKGKVYNGASSAKNIQSYVTNGHSYASKADTSKLGYGVKRRIFSQKELPKKKHVVKKKAIVVYNKIDLKKFVFRLNKILGNKMFLAFYTIKYQRGVDNSKEKRKKLCLRSSKKIFKSVFRQTAYCGLMSTLASIAKNRVSESFAVLKQGDSGAVELDSQKTRQISTTGKKRRKISMKLFLGFLTRLMKIVDSKYKRIVFLKIKANYFRAESHVKNVRLFGDIIDGVFTRKRELVKREFFSEFFIGFKPTSSPYKDPGYGVRGNDGRLAEFGYRLGKIVRRCVNFKGKDC